MEKQYKTNRPWFTVSRDWKTYRADKNCVIVADTPEIETIFKAYWFKPINEKELEAIKMVEQASLAEDIDIDECPNKKK